MFKKPKKVQKHKFGMEKNVMALLPAMSKIPDEFKNGFGNPYVQFFHKWFYKGITKDELPEPKPGIDFEDAISHLSAISGSWEPKHEHKEAAFAYLASLWFEEPKINF